MQDYSELHITHQDMIAVLKRIWPIPFQRDRIMIQKYAIRTDVGDLKSTLIKADYRMSSRQMSSRIGNTPIAIGTAPNNPAIGFERPGYDRSGAIAFCADDL
jgi:hypothetical protein